MGKRRIHDALYYQCDWTGVPMNAFNCYMPIWKEDGKMLKQGSYCNWESVVAAAQEKGDGNAAKVSAYVDDLVGTHVRAAPHWSDMWWLNPKGSIRSIDEFQTLCDNTDTPLTAVHITTNGQCVEVVVRPDEVKLDLGRHIVRPVSLHGPEHRLAQVLVTGNKKRKDKDICVMFWPGKNGLAYNQLASTYFKMQIYGDAMVMMTTKESSHIPRQRFVDMTHHAFTQHFTTRKRASDGITSDQFKVLKKEMESSLASVEAAASASACPPEEMMKGATIPPATGKELATLAKKKTNPALATPASATVA